MIAESLYVVETTYSQRPSRGPVRSQMVNDDQ